MKKEQEKLLLGAIELSNNETVKSMLRSLLLSFQVDRGMKFNLWNYAGRSSRTIHYDLSGIHYQNGFAEATNAHLAVRTKQEYPAALEGKVVFRDGLTSDGRYPNIDAVLPSKTREISFNDEWIKNAILAHKAAKKEEYIGKVKAEVSGRYFNPDYLQLFHAACKKLNLKTYIGETNGYLFAKNDLGELALLSDIVVSEEDQDNLVIFRVNL